MEFLEKDLEDIIFNADKAKLKERGLNIDGVLKRQLKIGNYGIADLVSFNKDYLYSEYYGLVVPYLIIDVYELKKDSISLSSFSQALRYCKGLSRYIHDHKGYEMDVIFNINLVGKSIDNRDSLIYLPDLIESNKNHSIASLNLYTYSYELEGLSFKNNEGYFLKNEGF